MQFRGFFNSQSLFPKNTVLIGAKKQPIVMAKQTLKSKESQVTDLSINEACLNRHHFEASKP